MNSKVKYVLLALLMACCIIGSTKADARDGKIPFQERHVLGHSPGGDDYGTLRLEYVEVEVKGELLECVASQTISWNTGYSLTCNWEKYNGRKNG